MEDPETQEGTIDCTLSSDIIRVVGCVAVMLVGLSGDSCLPLVVAKKKMDEMIQMFTKHLNRNA